jgi:hypothetical protein
MILVGFVDRERHRPIWLSSRKEATLGRDGGWDYLYLGIIYLNVDHWTAMNRFKQLSFGPRRLFSPSSVTSKSYDSPEIHHKKPLSEEWKEIQIKDRLSDVSRQVC